MITIRYYERGKVNTLYHYRKNKSFKGVLYVNQKTTKVKPSLHLEKIVNWIPVYAGMTILRLFLQTFLKILDLLGSIITIPLIRGVSVLAKVNKLHPSKERLPSFDSLRGPTNPSVMSSGLRLRGRSDSRRSNDSPLRSLRINFATLTKGFDKPTKLVQSRLESILVEVEETNTKIKETGLNIWKKISSGLVWISFLGFLIVLAPPLYSEINYRLSHLSAKAEDTKPPQYIPTPSDILVSDEFFLEIPKINLVSNILPNVDTENESIYSEKLKNGIAHAKGSYFPGESGPVVLFSHSTDTLARIVQYNAKFYALKELEIGDQVIIHFKGQTFAYSVSEKKIIDPQDLDTIRQANSKLILTTCWPPGTSWQRLVVFAT